MRIHRPRWEPATGQLAFVRHSARPWRLFRRPGWTGAPILGVLLASLEAAAQAPAPPPPTRSNPPQDDSSREKAAPDGPQEAETDEQEGDAAGGDEPSNQPQEPAERPQPAEPAGEQGQPGTQPPAAGAPQGQPGASQGQPGSQGQPPAPEAQQSQPGAAPGQPGAAPSPAAPTQPGAAPAPGAAQPDATKAEGDAALEEELTDPTDVDVDVEPTPPLPRDRVGGHFVAGAGAALAVPFGELSSGVGFHEIANAGLGLDLDLGYGVGRHVVLGVYGELQFYNEAEECAGCSTQSLGAGAFVRYHLVQGLRFDPWVSYGVGLRSIQVSGPQSQPVGDYTGLEWMRLTFAGDWYAVSQFGFGPFVQFGAASMFDRPSGQVEGGVNWRWQVGLRAVVDLPGK